MQTERALQELDAHHVRLLSHIDAAERLVTLSADQAQHRLARSRWELVRLLQAYQVFKHSEIFDPAIRSGSPPHVRAAVGMKAACIAAGEQFHAYVRDWSSRDVAAAWEEYRPAMLAMTATLRAHIAQERRTIRALLAGSDRTRKLGG